MAEKLNSIEFSLPNMTNEWIEWTGDNRLRTSTYRGSGCSNYLNNNHHILKNNSTNTNSAAPKTIQTTCKFVSKQKGLFIIS